MKVILIIDTMPECCYDCKYCRFPGGYVGGYYGRSCLLTSEDVQTNNFDITSSRHHTCPLKPLPEKKQLYISIKNPENFGMGWRFGYNACIDDILGGADE